MKFLKKLLIFLKGQKKGSVAKMRDKLQQDKQSPHGNPKKDVPNGP